MEEEVMDDDQSEEEEMPIRKRQNPKFRRNSLKRRKVPTEKEDDETYTENKVQTEPKKKPSPQSSSRHKIAKSPPQVARYSPMRSRKQRKLEETKMFSQTKKNKYQASSKKVTFS